MVGNNGKYGIGGDYSAVKAANEIDSYLAGTPLNVKMYHKITASGATSFEMSELLVNDVKKSGPKVFNVTDSKTIKYVHELCVGVSAQADGSEATVRYGNIRVYIADSVPSTGNEAKATVKNGVKYTVATDKISNIEYNTTAEEFLSNITISDKAAALLLDSSDNAVSSESTVDETMKLKIVSGNGKTTTVYNLDVNKAKSEIEAVIEGTPKVGETLTASYTTSNPAYDGCAVTYSWLACNTSDGEYTEIAGKTEKTLVLSDDCRKKYIKVKITPYIDGTPMIADISAATEAIVDEKADFKDSVNEADAKTVKSVITGGSGKFSEVKNTFETLDSDYKLHLACLNMLKGIPYADFDAVTVAFDSAARAVNAAFNDSTVPSFEAVAGNEGTVTQGHVDITPTENVFEYDGKEFIVIGNTDDEMYVITKDYYGTKAAYAEEKGIYNALDEKSIAYFLNRGFIADGNDGNKLPQGIINYINYGKVWVSEPQSGTGGTKTVGGIGLLSATEYKENAARIGEDTIPSGAVLYYLRTPNSKYDSHMLGLSLRELNGTSTRGSFIGSKANTARHLRPTFWLDKAFFEKNKLTKMGGDVAFKIASICSEEKLRALYGAEEMNAFFKSPEITRASVSGRPIIGSTLTADYEYKSDFKEKGTQYRWLSSATAVGGYSPITGKTGKTLILDNSLAGKFIMVEITPKSELAINGTGAVFLSKSTSCAVMTQSAADSAAEALNAVAADQIHTYLQEHDDIFQTTAMESDADIRNLAISYLAQSEFTTMDEYENDMNTCITMARLRAGDVSKVEEIITAADCQINKKNYAELADKSGVNSYIKATAFTSAEDFIKKVDDIVGVTYINNADRDSINGVLLRLDDMFTKDISALSDTQLTALGIGVLTVDSYSDMTAVDKKIDELYPTSGGGTDVNTPVSGSVNSSAGGGGGSRAGITTSNAGKPADTQNNDAVLSPFCDMAGYEWANTAVNKLVGKGVINGMGDGRFAPEENLTREQFVKMIVTAFGFKSSGKSNPFFDVVDGQWYTEYILAAYENGVTTGIGETRFGIGESLSKEQMVTFVYRAFEKAGINTEAQGSAMLKDKESVSEYAAAAVEKLSDAGIVSGDENGCFNPSQTATRAMAAVVIYKALENAEVSK